MITAPNGYQYGRAPSGHLLHLARADRGATVVRAALCGQVLSYASRALQRPNHSRTCPRCDQALRGAPRGGARAGAGRPPLDPEGETTGSTVQFTPAARRAVERWRRLIRDSKGDGITVPSVSVTVRTMLEVADDLERYGSRRALRTMKAALE